ncbi:MAG TPA: hypothetical protein VGF13_15815 [Verrucomicrobiae bacterium]
MNAKHLFLLVAVTIAVLLVSTPAARSADAPATTNRIARWLNGKSLPHLDVTQAETYVQQHQRRPEALLAACQATTDRGFLREAMAKHPRDPRVGLAAACSAATDPSNPSGAGEKRQWLDALKNSAPDNALAYYLSARDHFKTGQPDLAEKEVLAGAGRPLRDYALDFIEGAQDAYLSVGYSEPEAAALAMGSLLMPHLAQLRDVGTELIKRANHYRQGGDAAAANKMLHAAIRIGTQLDRTNSLTLLENLVGIAIQQNGLKEMDPAVPFGKSGRTVQAEADQLTQRRTDLRAIAGEFNKLFRQMSDKEIGDYFNQQKRVGEEMADRRALAR